MANDFYNHGGYPATSAAGASASARAEFDAIMAGFDKLPVLAGAGLKLVRVNAGATALESTNLIDGIAIGSVTPSTGAFTTLSATGDASFQGNVALGNAIGDTISIGGTQVKNGTGNYSLPAPSAGITLSVDALSGAATRSLQAGTIATGTNKPRIEFEHTEATGLSTLAFVASTGTLAGRIAIAGSSVIDITSNRNVTFQAPSSGVLATFNGLTTGSVVDVVAGNAARSFSTAVTDFATLMLHGSFGNTTAVGIGFSSGGGGGAGIAFGRGASFDTSIAFYTNPSSNAVGNGAVLRGSIASSGAWSLLAPTAGDTLTLGQLAGSRALNITASLNGSSIISRLENSSNTASSDVFELLTVGGTSGGDPYWRANVQGGGDWVFGIDNSDADAFVIGNASTLGTGNQVRLTAGVIGLPVAGHTLDFTSTGATQSQINSYNQSGLELVTRHASAALRFYSGNAGLALTLTTGGSALFENAALTRPVTGIVNSAGTVTVDASASNVHECATLTANVTTLTINNANNGQTISIRFKQDVTGGRTVANPSGAKVTGAVGATASAASLLTLTYSETDARWEGAWLTLPA